MFVQRLFFIALASALVACGQTSDDNVPVKSEDVVSKLDSSAPSTISMERFKSDVLTLSSDAFGGRLPSTQGERLTVDFLIKSFKDAGLVGGNDGSFVQEVPLVAMAATEISPLTFSGDQASFELATGPDAVVWTNRVTESINVADSPLVFVGYGVVAPEYSWNDYAGVDVTGKTVVMLVNDPGFASGDDTLFTGRSMTYYGRWAYKFEEAARQGATGVILIHETEAAGYPWSVVEGGWTGENFGLESADGNASRTAFESWITEAAAERLFDSAGLEYAEIKASAAKAGFTARAIPLKVSTAFNNTIQRSKSSNVVALLPGDVADETVAFSAHWDHLGTVDSGTEDGIYNGAVDNATGTAALLELARVLAKEPHRRSYLFLAVTAEEQGLLGSAWFANHPTTSLAKMAGLINIDAMSIIGPTRDVAVIGFGSSDLEVILDKAAKEQGRVLAPESTPEKGFFYRSDHFSFAKQGVPALYAKSGVDHLEKGREYGLAATAEYVAERYHKPSDEVYEGWDYRGIEQDLALYLAVARSVANDEGWPEWMPGNEFRAKREASASERR